MSSRRTQRTIYTVSDVSRRIKELIEREYTDIWIEGEVSNLRQSAAGHIYFTLKDEGAQIPAVCFRRAAMYLRFKPKDGESFRVRGRLGTYEARGEYQIIVEVLEPAGRGALQAAFERLKEKLDREGLFASARKRPLPAFPSRIGIVTSSGSAALRDVLSVLDRRHNAIHILIYPSEVQGAASSAQLVEGIDYLGGTDVDVVIVTRGGGSIEDLWPFNEERVARAIARCPHPVISAVGHEVDFTIADLVADVRAPTPSAAAEIVVASKREVLDRIDGIEQRLVAAVRYRLSELRRFLEMRVGGRGFLVAETRIRQMSQRVDDWSFRLERFARGEFLQTRNNRFDVAERGLQEAIGRRIASAKERLAAYGQMLDALSPLGVLDRGYAICRTSDGTVLRDASGIAEGSDIEVLLGEGALGARVTEVRESRKEKP